MTENDKSIAVKTTYHHGDLRRSLLDAAKTMIRAEGIKAVTMRKLAARVGVSRSALYHHFADKQDLLCALALEGFERQKSQFTDSKQALSEVELFSRHIRDYVMFAVENPEYYDLMFGRDIWKSGHPTEALKVEAYTSFRNYTHAIAHWQAQGIIPAEFEPTRFAQVSWSMLHGISRLLIDGIYVDREAMEGMCQTAAKMLLNRSPAES